METASRCRIDDSNFFALCEFASLLVTAELEGRGAPCLELNIISTSQHSANMFGFMNIYHNKFQVCLMA